MEDAGVTKEMNVILNIKVNERPSPLVRLYNFLSKCISVKLSHDLQSTIMTRVTALFCGPFDTGTSLICL